MASVSQETNRPSRWVVGAGSVALLASGFAHIGHAHAVLVKNKMSTTATLHEVEKSLENLLSAIAQEGLTVNDVVNKEHETCIQDLERAMAWQTLEEKAGVQLGKDEEEAGAMVRELTRLEEEKSKAASTDKQVHDELTMYIAPQVVKQKAQLAELRKESEERLSLQKDAASLISALQHECDLSFKEFAGAQAVQRMRGSQAVSKVLRALQNLQPGKNAAQPSFLQLASQQGGASAGETAVTGQAGSESMSGWCAMQEGEARKRVRELEDAAGSVNATASFLGRVGIQKQEQVELHQASTSSSSSSITISVSEHSIDENMLKLWSSSQSEREIERAKQMQQLLAGAPARYASFRWRAVAEDIRTRRAPLAKRILSEAASVVSHVVVPKTELAKTKDAVRLLQAAEASFSEQAKVDFRAKSAASLQQLTAALKGFRMGLDARVRRLRSRLEEADENAAREDTELEALRADLMSARKFLADLRSDCARLDAAGATTSSEADGRSAGSRLTERP